MLPLNTIFKKLFFAIFPLFIILISCSDRSKNDLAVIEALNESIENSNRVVNASTTEIMISLEEKLNDYSSKEKAMVWLPVAQTVQRVTKKAIDQIQEIKAKLEKDQKSNISEEDILNVYNWVLNYKSELLQIDSKLAHDYNRYLKIFTISIDSSKENQVELFKAYFSTASRTGAIAMLTKLQNNININEKGMITFAMKCAVLLSIFILRQVLWLDKIAPF
jgi:flagellin-specific chaperone FliS